MSATGRGCVKTQCSRRSVESRPYRWSQAAFSTCAKGVKYPLKTYLSGVFTQLRPDSDSLRRAP